MMIFVRAQAVRESCVAQRPTPAGVRSERLTTVIVGAAPDLLRAVQLLHEQNAREAVRQREFAEREQLTAARPRPRWCLGNAPHGPDTAQNRRQPIGTADHKRQARAAHLKSREDQLFELFGGEQSAFLVEHHCGVARASVHCAHELLVRLVELRLNLNRRCAAGEALGVVRHGGRLPATLARLPDHVDSYSGSPTHYTRPCLPSQPLSSPRSRQLQQPLCSRTSRRGETEQRERGRCRKSRG
mmetsp:Transcript_96761/g.273400  ORF Transcript_96761/g.273400 Transcript_96761/m.273400 type:complete len:243 (+) Transcript_96761:88-816(+)